MSSKSYSPGDNCSQKKRVHLKKRAGHLFHHFKHFSLSKGGVKCLALLDQFEKSHSFILALSNLPNKILHTVFEVIHKNLPRKRKDDTCKFWHKILSTKKMMICIFFVILHL